MLVLTASQELLRVFTRYIINRDYDQDASFNSDFACDLWPFPAEILTIGS